MLMEKQKKLFQDWRKDAPTIVSDGISDEQAYLSSSVKILYLLKEVNGGEGWDLCDFLADGGRAQTWDNITRWTMGIHQLDREIPWSELQDISPENRKEILGKICAVNVKKLSGTHTANVATLSKYLEDQSNKNRLREQLAIYGPDLIVCCGTDWLYESIYQSPPKWEMTSRGIWYARERDKIILSYAHPEARVKDCILYYSLVDAVKEIWKKR